MTTTSFRPAGFWQARKIKLTIARQAERMYNAYVLHEEGAIPYACLPLMVQEGWMNVARLAIVDMHRASKQ